MSKNHNTSIITFASGKGGVGKTSLSLNLALALNEKGNLTYILDADLGLANIDVLLGISPELSLMDYIEGKCSFQDVIAIGPLSLKILPGGSSLDKIPDFNDEYKKRLSKIPGYLKEVNTLIIDTSAGISEQVLFFLEAASMPVLVVAPEPTSLTDAYSLLKTYKLRGNKGPVFVMVNQADSAAQAKRIYYKFKDAVDRHLNFHIKSIGYVLKDENVVKAVTQQKPFVTLTENCPASRCIRLIADAISSSKFNNIESDSMSKLFPIEDSDDKKGQLLLMPPNDNKLLKPAQKESYGEIISLLMKQMLVTDEQIEYAVKVRNKLDNPRTLLETLKELGYVNDKQVKEVLFNNRTSFRLGSLLVELGHISEKQLSMALNEQKESEQRKLLGEILTGSNYISEYELTEALSISLGIPYFEPSIDMLDAEYLKKASLSFFVDHKFIPIREEDGSLRIVMADPLDSKTLDSINKLFGTDYSISISMGKYINEILEKYAASKDQKGEIKGDDNEIVKLVNDIINTAMEKNASDIHIEPMRNRIRIRFRRDGSLIHYTDLSKDFERPLNNRLKVMAGANITERRRHQDGRILIDSSTRGEEIDIRASFYVTIFGEKAVMRILSKKAELYKVEDLGMGSKMLERFREDVLELPSGVVIITGPTGAGKTTTLYASINYCNKLDTNIITAEDPVEYVIDGISQCTINPKLGVTFEETLRHMLRQDPDIMILGEIRDRFSAESAIQAALTGHKVLTTFHTEDSIGGLLRLMNMDIEAFLISSTVVCVVAQRLLKKICPYCIKDYTPAANELRRLRYQSSDVRGYNFKTGTGCARCDFTGYRGRVGVFEMLILNEYVKEAILNRKTSYEIRRTSIETTGLITLLEDGLSKAAKGMTTLSEVLKNLPLFEGPRPIAQINRLTGEL